MVITSSLSYPPEQSNEVAKRFRELPPVPSYITLKGPYLCFELGVGIKTITLYEYDQSKTKEALEFVGGRICIYNGVPGLTYSVHTWFEANEALKMIGLG